jgi:hypothetical protein
VVVAGRYIYQQFEVEDMMPTLKMGAVCSSVTFVHILDLCCHKVEDHIINCRKIAKKYKLPDNNAKFHLSDCDLKKGVFLYLQGYNVMVALFSMCDTFFYTVYNFTKRFRNLNSKEI